jgi:Flp pilus assembly secretin CpaC
VGVKTGQTIVIGGLMEDQKRLLKYKVPILGDIPLLDLVFSRTQTTKTKTELLIFLTPHVASDADDLQPMSNDEMQGTKLTPKAIGPNVFDEHMDGMQRGEIPTTRPAGPSSQVFRPGDQAELPPRRDADSGLTTRPAMEPNR